MPNNAGTNVRTYVFFESENSRFVAPPYGALTPSHPNFDMRSDSLDNFTPATPPNFYSLSAEAQMRWVLDDCRRQDALHTQPFDPPSQKVATYVTQHATRLSTKMEATPEYLRSQSSSWKPGICSWTRRKQQLRRHLFMDRILRMRRSRRM